MPYLEFFMIRYISFTFVVAIAALIYHVTDKRKPELNPFIVCLCLCVIFISFIWMIDISTEGGAI